MILPCRESPMTGTVACWNNGPFWAVLLPRDRRRREAQVSQVVTPDEDLAGALSVCDIWRGSSGLTHNQSVTWARSESMSACVARQRRREPEHTAEASTWRLARHVAPCTPCVAVLTRAAVCREDGPAAMPATSATSML